MRGSSPDRASARSSRTKSPSSRQPTTTPTSTSEPQALDPQALKARLAARAARLGFDAIGVAPAQVPPERQAAYLQALAQGHHGTMGWLATTAERRRTPKNLWPEARTVIALGLSYAPSSDPLAKLLEPDIGLISAYAQGDDYHELIKGRLKELAGWLARAATAEVKVFVDTAPLLEKPLAERAGLGWQGKHTNLVSRGHGSWLFLGEILTSAALPPDAPETDHCGRCRRCLDICPTDAFPAPYRLDARRCLAYLTIEHQGPIPHAFRRAMGNRIYGCDDCLAVCPWNKFAEASREVRLQARPELAAPSLVDLARLDDAAFRALFRKSPIKRIGRNRFLRNVLIALGNAKADAAHLLPHLADDDPLVRGAAVWALGEVMERAAFVSLAGQHVADERAPSVVREWRVAAELDRGEGLMLSSAEQA
ncbi:MAG: tRNA epoxyqueuosine(34) reductase QueG [Geminicoccaceae bacterium]|nr:MAG: tRNA epoxyqueuosine(34) reductase QueG [Geminicoccaceae bacterium]